MLIATHADADHVQAGARPRERLKAKTGAPGGGQGAPEAGDAVQDVCQHPRSRFFEIEAACRPARSTCSSRRRRNRHRQAATEVCGIRTARPHPWVTHFSKARKSCSSAATRSYGTLRGDRRLHGSNLQDFEVSLLTRIRDDEAEFLCRITVPWFFAKIPRFFKMRSTG